MLTLWGSYRTQSTKGRGVWKRRQVKTLWDSHPCSEATVSTPALSQEDQSPTNGTHNYGDTHKTDPPNVPKYLAGRCWVCRCSGCPGVALGPDGPTRTALACRGDMDLHLLLKSSAETLLPVFPIVNSLKHRGNWKKKKNDRIAKLNYLHNLFP